MSTWEAMSQECLHAAKRLLDDGRLRRSISSSYYAAYSAIAGALAAKSVTYARGWRNPAHEQLPQLILNNLALSRSTGYQINKAIRRLRMERENADYRPGVDVTRRTAVDAVHDSVRIISLLEVEGD